MGYGESPFAGIRLINGEREYQYYDKGYKDEHDDAHFRDELITQAIALLTYDKYQEHPALPDGHWVEPAITKHDLENLELYGLYFTDIPKLAHARIKDLTRAGALIAAEIDRLERLKNANVDG